MSNNYKEVIEELHGLTELNSFDFVTILNKTELKFTSRYYDFGNLVAEKYFEQAAINLIKSVLPKARYGFDFNPAIQPDKNGREKTAQGWVKYGGIDWSISHKHPSIAMIIALLHVLHDLEVLRNKITDDKLPPV